MNSCKSFFLFLTLITLSCLSIAQKKEIKPVTPNVSPEAKALLEYIYSISGKYILTGQHNYPISGDRNSQFAADYIGETPVVWSQDFGFSEDGDKDSYLARPAIVKEAINQHKKGSIINLCWHAVPPTANEPVTFQPLPGYDSTALASVQGRLLDQQFKDLLTPGTKIHKQWIKQVDEIAKFLKQLQDAKVPVIWRPYHEMNGNWFWWGGRYQGKYTTASLYRQIFDRMVNYHKLNNLIWVWSVDRPSTPDRTFDKYYPGTQYLDILAIDIYGNDFAQSYYDDLMKLSEGKPITLAEVGNPPSIEILEKQPNWVYWVVWADMARNTSKAEYEKLSDNPRTLFMEDQMYHEGTVNYRTVCGFQPLIYNRSVDFTGEWILNECESSIQYSFTNNNPYKLALNQKDNDLHIKSTTVVEWKDDEVTEQILTLDGKDVKSTVFNNSPRVQNVNWSKERDSLTIDSKITFSFGEKKFNVKSKEIWVLKRKGRKLVIYQTIDTFRGKQNSTLVYYKQ